MTQSTRPPTFDIVTAHDFYNMLVADFDEYIDSPLSSRLALHCVIIAYHLYQWVWGDWLKRDKPAQKIIGMSSNKEADFVEWIKRPGNFPNFEIIRGLTNGAKHFAPQTNLATPPLFSFDTPDKGWDEGAWNLVIDLGANKGADRWLPASDLLTDAVRFWQNFLKQYHPAPNLAVSKHLINADGS